MSPFHGDGETILSLALSTELLAYVTFEGYLHVAKLTEPTSSTRLRLPSADVGALGTDSLTVAVGMRDHNYNFLHFSEVILFEAESQQSRTFEVDFERKAMDRDYHRPFQPSPNCGSILVDSHKEVVDLFMLAVSAKVWPRRTKTLDILHLRANFAGETIAVDNWLDELEVNKSEDTHIQRFTMAPPIPVGYRGRFRIQVGQLPVQGGLPLRFRFDGVFDANENHDEEVTGQCGFVSRDNSELEATHYAAAESPHRRKQVSATVYAQWKSLAIQSTQPSNNGWLEYYSLMNDTFLVSLEVRATQTEHSRIRIFCFDPNVTLYDGRSTGFWDGDAFQPEQRWRGKRKRDIG